MGAEEGAKVGRALGLIAGRLCRALEGAGAGVSEAARRKTARTLRDILAVSLENTEDAERAAQIARIHAAYRELAAGAGWAAAMPKDASARLPPNKNDFDFYRGNGRLRRPAGHPVHQRRGPRLQNVQPAARAPHCQRSRRMRPPARSLCAPAAGRGEPPRARPSAHVQPPHQTRCAAARAPHRKGTFVRTRAIDASLLAALAPHAAAQVVVLGAGFDTRWHRLFAREAAIVRYVEVDFAEILARKGEALVGAASACDPRYVALPVDLARPFCEISSVLRAAGLSPEYAAAARPRPRRRVSTVFLSECFLMYMRQEAARQILAGLAASWRAPACAILFEPLLLPDAFSEQMLANFKVLPRPARRSRGEAH